MVQVGTKVLDKVLPKVLTAAAPVAIIDPSVFDGGTIKLYSLASSSDAGDLLASGTLPSKAFANESGGERARHGNWSMVATKNGTARGLLISNVGATINTWKTVTTSGGGGDVIIDHSDVQIGDIIALATMVWVTDPTGLYPNRPSGYTSSSEIDFSQAIPALPDSIDRAIAGTDWYIIRHGGTAAQGGNYSQQIDATAPQSPSDIWQGHWAPGAYGEQHTIPSSPYQVTVTWAANFGADLLVADLTAGEITLTKVGSSPASGQYSVSAGGVYTFAAADAGHIVLISYSFSSVVGVTNGATGTGGGHGIGNIFTYGPSAQFLSNPTPRIYLSARVYVDLPDATYWHSISDKWINIFGDHSTILVQLRESTTKWRHAEELGNGDPYFNFYVDSDPSVLHETHYNQVVANPAVPTKQWTQIEVLIDIPNRIFKIWQDGVLTTDATPTFASTVMNTIGFYAFRGGGGEALTADMYWNYDHLFIAW